MEFMAGADISALTALEDNGAEYSVNGQPPTDAIEIFRDKGVNWFRLRLFVNPDCTPGCDGVVVNDLDYTIDLAQRAQASGAKVLLDFHYSDTWADPSQQAKPAAWSGLNFSSLVTRVHDYTRDSVQAFKDAGVLPEMVQFGNEIANGMLFNDGYVWTGGSHSTGFNNLASLMSAGINGANEAAGPGNEPLVMIHHDQGGNWDGQNGSRWFLDRIIPRLQNNGTPVDMIGLSYYPKFHYSGPGNGDLADVQTSLNNAASTYGKPVAIVETGFPFWGAQWEPDYDPLDGNPNNNNFDVSEQGQQEFLQALVDVVQNVPNDMGQGVFWWYPEALNMEVNDDWVWEGGRYGLFDEDGEALPALDVFNQFIPVLAGDYNGDGKVSAADYTVWRDTLGSTTDLRANGDDSNSVIDQDDYLVWLDNYGFGNGSGSGAGFLSSSVPEPASIALLVGLMLGAILFRHR
jgi:arabinogalactan endo-1,4-beta-galactosidase